MYGPPPVRKRFCIDGLKRSASMYPARLRSVAPGHDGYPRVSVLIKLTASLGHFLNQVPETPVRPFVHRCDRARRQELFRLVVSLLSVGRRNHAAADAA